jgi:hypothetical protein
MGSAAQRDIVDLVLSAFPVRVLVMVLHPARAPTATTLPIDERATTAIASPYLTSNRGWNCAC